MDHLTKRPSCEHCSQRWDSNPLHRRSMLGKFVALCAFSNSITINYHTKGSQMSDVMLSRRTSRQVCRSLAQGSLNGSRTPTIVCTVQQLHTSKITNLFPDQIFGLAWRKRGNRPLLSNAESESVFSVIFSLSGISLRSAEGRFQVCSKVEVVLKASSWFPCFFFLKALRDAYLRRFFKSRSKVELNLEFKSPQYRFWRVSHFTVSKVIKVTSNTARMKGSKVQHHLLQLKNMFVQLLGVF
jgi:hypothetical protein